MATPGRILIALGGNAIAGQAGGGPVAEQLAVADAMEAVADVVAAGSEVVLTHGNGPQVGDLLLSNELARGLVPRAPLDWCVAETQATLGYLIASSLERALAERAAARLVVPVLTRVLVDASDPAWLSPTKPIGRYLPAGEARKRISDGEDWVDQGEKGWRRVVPSPDPKQILEAELITRLVAEGSVVIAAGGGGIPMLARDGLTHGAEAVLDKDLTAALLATQIGAECLVIATDVPAAAIGFGTPDREWLGHVTPDRLHALVSEGHFAAGSMGPKIEAVLRFVDRGGKRAVIGPLERLAELVSGDAGTVVAGVESPCL